MRFYPHQTRVQFGGQLPVLRGARQYGGGGNGMPVFRGAREYQYGRGIGNVFRALMKIARPFIRKAAPIALASASTLLNEVDRSRAEGRNWKESFGRAIAPAASQGYEAYRKMKNQVPAESAAATDNQESESNYNQTFTSRPPQIGKGLKFNKRKIKTNRFKKVYKDLNETPLRGAIHYNF